MKPSFTIFLEGVPLFVTDDAENERQAREMAMDYIKNNLTVRNTNQTEEYALAFDPLRTTI